MDWRWIRKCCAYEFDQGNIGGVLTFPAFRSTFGNDELSDEAVDEREGVVAGMLSAGGAGGAHIAAPLADFLGRKYAIAIMSAVFMLGAALQEVPLLDAMYAGRSLAGLPIGATSMLSLQFLAENSPKSIRGALTTSYSLMIIMALALAFWINYVPIGTPRALIARGKDEEGLKNLCKLRQLPAEHPYVQHGYNEIVAQTESEQSSARSFNYIAVFKSLACSATNRCRFLLSMLLFLLQKLTGIDAFNYFAPQTFTMIGVPADIVGIILPDSMNEACVHGMDAATASTSLQLPQAYKGASSRVTRSSLACLPCRSRHLKCDSRRPRCGRCVEAEKDCDYAQSRRGGLDRAALAERRKRLATAQAQNAGLPLGSAPDRDTGIRINIPQTICITNDPWAGPGLGFGRPDTSSPTPASSDLDGNAIESDALIHLYYSNFHSLHPFVPPRKHLIRLCQDESRWPSWKPLVATLRLVGHLYGSHEWSSALEANVLDCLSHSSQPDPILVQARLLFSMVLFWHGFMSGAKREMDMAAQGALEIGLFRREFAANHGDRDPVLQESWRRTWWMLYVADAYYAGTLGTTDLAVSDVEATVELPCEESEYESGDIPLSKTMDDFECREFEPETTCFSSFAYLIGATQCASLALLQTLGDATGGSSTQVHQAADAVMDGWLLLLPEHKRQLMNKAGEVDELMFQAHLMIHVTTVGIHRPLSDLKFNDIEDVSSCAREPARAKARADLINVHTVRVLRAVEAQIHLLTLPSRPFHHTPFTTCMVSEGTLALLSACNYLLKGKELAVARDQIRVTIGCLRSLGEVWPRTARNVTEIQTIARHVLGMERDFVGSHTTEGDQVPSLSGGGGQPSVKSSGTELSSNGQSSEPFVPDAASQWFSLDDLQPDFAWWPDGYEDDSTQS
ncbi:C6 zinc finger domain-containing protein [Emericellopsis cladophorae]|uniref:C6 zinc finger domain-containing protein n=1 Tax=Emericellopsis cladophorae TaxID=2686198 RepID=A0A9P9Y1K2_9HYPO|nr:C6 zinc finger domain-containing protein [Emericellopsis cladophorae]KAI6781458.1 C6 zinc finger domain-containing protein [Emericellopsis cladophorae]